MLLTKFTDKGLIMFTAKYRGQCQRTGQAILPGDKVEYNGKKIVLVQKTRGSDFSDLYVIGNKEYIQNARGRCEDAPCCGCCTF